MRTCYLLLFVLLLTACSKQQPTTPDNPTNPIQNPTPDTKPPTTTPSGYDLEVNGIPKFVTADYIELSKIYRISKFRSGHGHDYSDNFEQCRSMKHYYQPYSNINWADVKIFAPVTGMIEKIDQEWAGKQVHIIPDNYPDFKIIIFHVNINPSLSVGTKVTAGQQLGTHISDQTTSDVTVSVNTTKGFKLISCFDVMTDGLFDEYKKRGILTRASAIISKADRDANPLSCNGEAFSKPSTNEDWVVLNP